MKIKNEKIKYVITYMHRYTKTKGSVSADSARERDRIVKILKNDDVYSNVKVKTI